MTLSLMKTGKLPTAGMNGNASRYAYGAGNILLFQNSFKFLDSLFRWSLAAVTLRRVKRDEVYMAEQTLKQF